MRKEFLYEYLLFVINDRRSITFDGVESISCHVSQSSCVLKYFVICKMCCCEVCPYLSKNLPVTTRRVLGIKEQ